MATAVLVPVSAINLNGGVLPSSAITQPHSPRHGRSRGASISKGKGGRSRGYSLVDDRETTVSKAVIFVLKRVGTVKEREKDGASVSDEGTDDDTIIADADGWVAVDDVLSHQRVSALGVTLSELQLLASSPSPSKTRQISLRPNPSAPEKYQIRRVSEAATSPTAEQPQATDKSTSWRPITADMEDVPEFVIYETSYSKYHLILTSGLIKRAGGQPNLAFVEETSRSPSADVSVWIHLPSALKSHPEIVWQRTESGSIITADEVPSSVWKRAVARRGDLGVLYEDGVVRKEVPVGLRGKGAKARKGKGALKSKAGVVDDGSDSGSVSE